MINDTISIHKAGDVIPEVVSVIKERRDGTQIPFKMIEFCPICGSKLVRKETEAAYYCENKLCDARKIEGLIHFVSRDAMYIDGFGERIIEDFYNMGFLKSVVDFYSLKKHKQNLMELEGFGEKSINNLLESIEKSKENSLDRLLFALGIRHVGKKTATILARKYENIDNLINTDYETLVDIPDIGEIIAASVYDYFKNQDNLEIIKKLKENNVNMEFIGNKIIKNDNFLDKTFVLTGTLSDFSREEASELIIARGGKVTNSVTKKTSVVLVGENPGSKYDKAKSLNIPIWNESEFKNMLEKI